MFEKMDYDNLRYQHETSLCQTRDIKAGIINLEESIFKIEDRLLDDTNTERMVSTLESRLQEMNMKLTHMKIAYAKIISKFLR